MKAGVIGIGEMGGGIAKNLLEKLGSLVVHDLRDEIVEQFVKKGATKASSPKEIGGLCDVVVTSLPMTPPDPTLENVILGEGGILEGMTPGKIIVDCGNTSPLTARKLNQQCEKVGVSYLDAGVSGGPMGSQAGTLAIFAGGSPEAVEKAKPVFEAIGRAVTYFGASGSGQIAKMINNVLCTINMAAIAEALVLGKKAGLDPEKLFSSVSMGTGQSWVLDNFGKILLERQPGQKATRMRSHEKQLAWAFQIASELEVPIPVTACAHELTKIAHAAGKCGSYEAIIELWEDITGTFFSKNA